MLCVYLFGALILPHGGCRPYISVHHNPFLAVGEALRATEVDVVAVGLAWVMRVVRSCSLLRFAGVPLLRFLSRQFLSVLVTFLWVVLVGPFRGA